MAVETKERSYVVVRSRESLDKPPTTRDYYQALIRMDYKTAVRLYQDPRVNESWSNDRYLREAQKCGAYDEGEQSLVVEKIPGISRAIDNYP